MKIPRLLLALLIGVIAVFAWSAVGPHSRGTWWAEVAPVIIALPLLIATRDKFPLTSLVYILIAVHCVILLIGGHYTYALTPVGEWMKDVFGFERNHYDRIGHLAQGFVPAMIGRELLIRTSPLKPGKWLFTILVLACLGIAAIYELIEWAAALVTGEGATQFLGTQGDEWDSQKDMALAGIGAILAQLTLARLHDRQLKDMA